MPNCLITLDKCSEVRHVGSGETLRQIIGKMVCANCLDLAVQYGTDQLCAGIKYGIGGAVHVFQ